MCRRHGGNWRRLGPRGRRLWKPEPVDPPGQMLQMLEGPLPWEVKGLLWKSWEKATQWNHQKGRRLVTAATTTIPPSHRQHQHQHRLHHHLSDILGFYPGCRKAWAHLKGPPRSTATEATSFGEVTKEDGGLSTSTPVKALPPLSPPHPHPRPRGSYGCISCALEHFCGPEKWAEPPTADRESTTALRGRCHPWGHSWSPSTWEGVPDHIPLPGRVPVRPSRGHTLSSLLADPSPTLTLGPGLRAGQTPSAAGTAAVLQTKDSGTIFGPRGWNCASQPELKIEFQRSRF